jgi:hypothetical protein
MSEEYVSSFRFQARCRVAKRDCFDGKDRVTGRPSGEKVCSVVLKADGSTFKLFGESAKRLFESVPAVNEECLVSGTVEPAGELFKRPVYFLELQTVGAVPARARA